MPSSNSSSSSSSSSSLSSLPGPALASSATATAATPTPTPTPTATTARTTTTTTTTTSFEDEREDEVVEKEEEEEEEEEEVEGENEYKEKVAREDEDEEDNEETETGKEKKEEEEEEEEGEGEEKKKRAKKQDGKKAVVVLLGKPTLPSAYIIGGGGGRQAPLVNVTYTLWVGSDVKEVYNLTVSAPKNETFYEVMVLAAQRSPNFQFSAYEWPNGHYVHTLAGYKEEPMSYHYWLLYRLTSAPSPASPPGNTLVAPGGVDDLQISDSEHYLFWYKKL